MITKTYGFERKRDLPRADGNPKTCNKCRLWFLAGPRERLCTACLPRKKRAEKALRQVLTRPRGFKGAKAQVRRGLNCRLEARETSFAERLTHVSQACRYPKQPQADHLPSARQHPYAGDRPEESGWCTGACNCTCHVKVYEGLMA
jgi:hypothetical protein